MAGLWALAFFFGRFCLDRAVSRSISCIWFHTASRVRPMTIHLSRDGFLFPVHGALTDTASRPAFSAASLNANCSWVPILTTTISRCAGRPVAPFGNASAKNFVGSAFAFCSTGLREFQDPSLAVLFFFRNSLFNSFSIPFSSGSIGFF